MSLALHLYVFIKKNYFNIFENKYAFKTKENLLQLLHLTNYKDTNIMTERRFDWILKNGKTFQIYYILKIPVRGLSLNIIIFLS